jgi:hypothetical protein
MTSSKGGSGAIIRQGLSKVVAYRGKASALHLRSATCTQHRLPSALEFVLDVLGLSVSRFAIRRGRNGAERPPVAPLSRIVDKR